MSKYDELIKRLRNQCRGYSKECKSCGADGSCRCQMEGEAADAIEGLSKPKWIPVTERLPEGNGRYLAVLKRYGFVDDIKLNDEQIRIMRYHDKWYLPYHVPDWINDTLKQEVTHWMPLPTPPKEDK